MADCEYERRVHAYHDGELPPGERTELDQHLGRCPACARELEDLRRLSRLFASARMPDLAPEALERLHGSACSAPERVLVYMSELSALAAAVVFLACAAWLWRANTGEQHPLPAWESAAVTLQAPSDTEADVAQWIVWNLGRGTSND